MSINLKTAEKRIRRDHRDVEHAELAAKHAARDAPRS